MDLNEAADVVECMSDVETGERLEALRIAANACRKLAYPSLASRFVSTQEIPMTSNIQTAVDAAARAHGSAVRSAREMMARHLRQDHKMGLRKTAERTGLTVREVKQICGEDS